MGEKESLRGKASRRKGKCAEYGVRDALRAYGLKADRVPSSGASQGFPGDIAVYNSEGRKALAEVKSRQNEFKTIYAWYETVRHELNGNPAILHVPTAVGTLIIADDFSDLGILLLADTSKEVLFCNPPSQALRKLTGLYKLVKECDFLVIKINNKPFLYIRYLGERV